MAEQFDIVVVGGGIAGLTAGRVAAEVGRKPLVLIGGVLGGHLTTIEKIDGHPDYPDGVAGYELCPLIHMGAAEAGAYFSMETADTLESVSGEGGDYWIIKAAGKEYTARAVILATGTRMKSLGVPGEERLSGKGVSQCASCDAPLMRNKPVVVVGGGDSACQEALTLLPHVSKITLVTDGESLTAQAAYADPLLANPKVEVRYNSNVEEVLGDNGVTAVRLREAGDGIVEVDAHGIFIFIGLEGNADLVADRLTVDADGRVAADSHMRTALPGLFAAGTIRQGSRGRATASAGEGEIAAAAAHRYLNDGNWG